MRFENTPPSPHSTENLSEKTEQGSLLGREQAARQLHDAYLASRTTSSSHLVLIEGASGTGKTTLVHHLQSELPQDVFFLEGKFYQYSQGQPFQAIVQLIGQFEHRIAARKASAFREIRTKWAQDLKPHLPLLQVLLPDSQLLNSLSEKERSDRPTVNETQIREAFLALFHSMARSCEALVIFVDDLQWADESSLSVLQTLWLELNKVPVLFTGSFRNEEAAGPYAVQNLKELVKKHEDTGQHITLDAFSKETVTDWLLNQSNHGINRAGELGDIVWRKTLGNPFYLNQFYQLLMDNELLYKHKAPLPWEWKDKEIEGQPGTENLVPALKRRLNALNETTLTLLQWAACLGTTFDAALLAKLTGYRLKEVDTALEKATRQEFVLPKNAFQAAPEYGIAHDQIQRALYESLTDEQKGHYHLAIARQLMEQSEQSPSINYLVANHLGLAGLPETDEDKLAFRRYHYKAGKQALATTAYAQADAYLQRSLAHFGPDDWQHAYEETLEYHLCALESAGYNKDLPTCSKLFEQLKSQPIGDYDELRLLQVYSLLQLYFKEYDKGYEYARLALEKAGIPVATTPEARGEGMQALVQSLSDPGTIARFEKLHISDEKDEIVNTLFNQLCVYAYNVSPQDIAYYTFLWAHTSLDRGISAPTTDAYSFVAMVYTSMHNFGVAFKYGELTEKLAERFNHPVYKNRALSLVYAHCLAWNHSYQETMQVMEDSYPGLVKYGEWIWAAGTLFNTFLVGLMHGADLQETSDLYRRFFMEYQKPEAQQIFGFLPDEAISVVNEYLLETGVVPDKAEKVLAEAKESNPMISSVALTVLSRLYVLAGDYEKALEVSEANYQALVEFGACGGQLHNVSFHFDQAIALCHSKLTNKEHFDKEEKLKLSMERLAMYAEINPDNFAGYHHLAVAMQHMTAGDTGQAYAGLMQTIKHAQLNGHTLLAAMAYEQAGTLAASDGLHLAKGHYIEAYHHYKQCGATGKAEEVLTRKLQGSRNQIVAAHEEGKEVSLSPTQSIDLDVKALMDSSLAISRQVKLDLLLRRLMEIISQNTGAERVIIALQKDDDMYLEGVHTASDTRVLEEIPLNDGQPIPDAYRLSEEVVHAVANTQKTILLGDAWQTAGPYKNTRYIQEQKPRSILCMPLIYQGDVMGVLYLENNSQTYAFTRDRLEILTLLSAQITTSIRNAGMYSTLEAKVALRTHELQVTNQELAALNEFKEKLTGLIAHDLKSPLSNIIGLSEQDPSGDTHQKINQLSRYMEQMILDILETRRLESPEMKPQVTELAIGKLKENALEQLAWIIRDRHIKLQVTGHKSLKVLADERLMVRVLVNLINNAIVHNPEAKHIKVTSEKAGDDFLRISIKDKGKPIPAEVIDKIFEPYHSQAKAGAGRFRSTGLGLTYCKLAVESHQGEIGATSDTEGNTFWFTLPLVPGQQAQEDSGFVYGEDTSEPSLMPDEAMAVLKPYADRLNGLQVNQLTAILKVLREAGDLKNPAAAQWIRDVEEATYACDEPRYRELLKMIP
ncbi:AAA family ATPase [Roseivirga sp. BDSF3-8]|uniref:sensor histidine kinase n=1 Tax=Roseivirga sp. BDSF3-8 TaxID=3241598 RepID=UPI00353245C7